MVCIDGRSEGVEGSWEAVRSHCWAMVARIIYLNDLMAAYHMSSIALTLRYSRTSRIVLGSRAVVYM
jgi:hypothetical protein